jgi:hypothetical protein
VDAVVGGVTNDPMGAVYLQAGVCLLPKTDDHVRRQQPSRDRQGKLFLQRRWAVDADQKDQAPPDLRYFKQSQK